MKVVQQLLLVAVVWWLRQGGAPTVAGNCAHRCGRVPIPYPFGLEPQCARSKEFLLYCNTTDGSGGQLLLGNIPIRKISVGDSTMLVSLPELHECYNKTGQLVSSTDNLYINLTSYPPYRVSAARNNLTVLGCDTYVLMTDRYGLFRSGCISYCSEYVDLAKETTCSGLGCCQASIPKGLKMLRIRISSVNGHVSVSQFNPCGVAFVGDKMSFNLSSRRLPTLNDLGKRADLVLDWMIGWDVTCAQARLNQSSYGCGNNTDCDDFTDGQGYRCFCKAGDSCTHRLHICWCFSLSHKPTSFVANKSEEPISIIPHFISSVNDGTLFDVINFKAASEDEIKEVKVVAKIAVKCLDQSNRKRPTISEVA
ncbi:hypothetical protein EUGRSUZ_D00254 [Eucalyptus grandis]|uniref:Uncharacterized protein n=1 Tax=Eucalyptus grandis TaxID=71139 RepID=A0ACC3L498_EUCGR|nr:hypothetical protein EUGRSUZ_D00254 [Eucalyptus grandis]